MKNQFKFIESTDHLVEDDGYELIANPDITIQVAEYAGGYGVDEWLEEEEVMQHHGIYKTLSQAMFAAVKVHNEAQ